MNNLMIGLIAVIALSLGVYAKQLSSAPEQPAMNSLLEFTLPDLQGKPHNIKEWQGKILVINFWATWCPPCRKEIPEFIALQNQYGDKGLQFIGVAIEDTQPVAEFAKKIGINYPILIAEAIGIMLAGQLGNSSGAVPFTIVVNQQNKIIYRHPGELSKQQLQDVILPLL